MSSAVIIQFNLKELITRLVAHYKKCDVMCCNIEVRKINVDSHQIISNLLVEFHVQICGCNW